MSQETTEMSLNQLGIDAVSEMPPVSPQFNLKPAKPDADGKFRDIRGKIFNPGRHASDKNGIPLKTARGYFKLLPGVPMKEPVVGKPSKIKKPELPEPKNPVPPATVEEVTGRKINASESSEAQKKNTSITPWFLFAVAATGLACIIHGARRYFKR